jgi:hypothetical protein
LASTTADVPQIKDIPCQRWGARHGDEATSAATRAGNNNPSLAALMWRMIVRAWASITHVPDDGYSDGFSAVIDGISSGEAIPRARART